jgi:hypothetical protein
LAKQTINVGDTPNDGTGDLVRDSFIKVNDNFDEIYSGFETESIILASNTGLTLGESTIENAGYSYLPNGLKMNWGQQTSNSSSGSIVFSSAFSTEVFTITVTGNDPENPVAVISYDVTGAQLRTQAETSSNVFWLAIGQ